MKITKHLAIGCRFHKAWSLLEKCDGVLIPGGFGERGFEGKIIATNWARLNNKPFLGLRQGCACWLYFNHIFFHHHHHRRHLLGTAVCGDRVCQECVEVAQGPFHRDGSFHATSPRAPFSQSSSHSHAHVILFSSFFFFFVFFNLFTFSHFPSCLIISSSSPFHLSSFSSLLHPSSFLHSFLIIHSFILHPSIIPLSSFILK